MSHVRIAGISSAPDEIGHCNAFTTATAGANFNLNITAKDAFGNLASDNGDTFKAVSRLQAGVAIALAAEAPPLTASQNFGVRVGWGNYQGDANAVAASAIGVLCRGCFGYNDRITVDGSVGAGWSNFMSYTSGNVVGGRAGVSWGW